MFGGREKTAIGVCTSGNVPFENTLARSSVRSLVILELGILHQQTGLSAGTITNDDEFSSNFSHSGRDQSPLTGL